MNKKFFVSISIILSIIFSFTFCLANDGNMLDDAANGARSIINGTENAVKNVVNGTENAMNTTGNAAENVAAGISNTARNITGDMQDGMNNYTTTRVATENNFMGMSNNAWTWLIVGITAIAIIALIWYYSMQTTNSGSHSRYNYHDDNDE